MRLFEILPELKYNPVFNCSSDEYVEKYINERTLKLLDFSPKDTVYSSAAGTPKVGIVVSGIATVSSASGGSVSLLRTLSRGDMFGVSNLYAENVPFPSVISAKSNVTCLFIEANAFKSFIEDDKETLRRYLRLMSNKIVYLNHKITVFTAENTEKKLAVFIYDNQVDGILDLSYSMCALANMIGVGRASLYRAIDRLTELGLITRNEKRITVPDTDALKRFFI